MSLPLKLDFSNYDNFLTEPNYTTSAEAQDYFRNMDMLVEALIDVGLWQPETNYPNGHVVFSPNMPNGTEAVCVATNGGKSSNAEPSWGEVGGDNVSDGTCFWKLRWKHWSKDVASVDDMKNGTSNDKIVTPKLARLGQTATNRLPNTTYSVGNVAYADSNLSVALKCTTAGATSNTELDISGNGVGESVEDGSVVWKVIARSNALDEGGVIPIANGGTGGNTFVKALSINGKTITVSMSDGTNKTLTTQDTGVTPARYVTSKYTSGTTWYEVYNDGWVRQGGLYDKGAGSGDATCTITLTKAFKDTNYIVIPTVFRNDGTTANRAAMANIYKKATGNFKAGWFFNGSACRYLQWVAEGMGA